MLTILVTLIFASGFVGLSYLYLKHIQRLEILIKARDLGEVKNYEELKEVTYVENPQPDNLSDAIVEKSPEEIRQMFTSQPL